MNTNTNITKFSKWRIALCVLLAVLLVASTVAVIFLSVHPKAFAAVVTAGTIHLYVNINTGIESVTYSITGSNYSTGSVTVTSSSSKDYDVTLLQAPFTVTWTATAKDGYTLQTGSGTRTITRDDISSAFNQTFFCSITATANADAQPLPVTPTKTGYTFTGWYTDEACQNLYTEDTVTSDVTLYAGWRANNYTIVFNGNGNDSGTMTTLSMSYDTAKNLTSNAFIRTGYKFNGWATSESGTVTYTNNQSVTNLTSTDGGIINLYAVWQANSYTIKFNGNGNDGGEMASMQLTYEQEAKLPSNTFTRVGYTFVGWALSAEGDIVAFDGESISKLTATANGEITLYAVWAINVYKVTFIVDGEIYCIVNVEHGTPTADVVGSAVDSTLYEVEGELPNA